MGLIDAFPLRTISKVGDPAPLYAELLHFIVRFARYGLIHGDFNEFNILIEEKFEGDERVKLIPTIIDFPQMVSIDHANAEYYFDRDVACIKRFFDRRFGFTSDEPGPFFKDATKHLIKRLDVEVEASGFSKKMAKELDMYMKEHGVDGDAGDAEAAGEERGDDEFDFDDDAEAQVEDEEDNEEERGPSFDDAQSSDLPPAEDSSAQTTELTASALASHMTILDIHDTDPVPHLSEFKPPPQPTISTKAAKKKAGWAI
jgi:RIO kinase 2